MVQFLLRLAVANSHWWDDYPAIANLIFVRPHFALESSSIFHSPAKLRRRRAVIGSDGEYSWETRDCGHELLSHWSAWVWVEAAGRHASDSTTAQSLGRYRDRRTDLGNFTTMDHGELESHFVHDRQ
jgi:hypothetical protein